MPTTAVPPRHENRTPAADDAWSICAISIVAGGTGRRNGKIASNREKQLALGVLNFPRDGPVLPLLVGIGVNVSFIIVAYRRIRQR